MRFSTLFKNKIKTPPGPHMNRQKSFCEIFRFGEDIFSKFTKKCVSTWLLTTHTVGWVKNIYFSSFVKHQSLSRCNPNGDGTLPQSSCQVQCTHYITTIYSRAAPLHHAWESTKYTSNHEVFVIFIGYFNPYCVYTRSVTNRTHSQVAWRKITSKDQV